MPGKNCKMVSDTEELPIGEKNTSILFQTTILPEKFEKIEENAKNFEKKHHNLVGIFNTILLYYKSETGRSARIGRKVGRGIGARLSHKRKHKAVVRSCKRGQSEHVFRTRRKRSSESNKIYQGYSKCIDCRRSVDSAVVDTGGNKTYE